MNETSHTRLLSRKISDYCRIRIDPLFPPHESARIRAFLLNLISCAETPPRKLRDYDWHEIGTSCDLDGETLRSARTAIEPALDAIARNTKTAPKRATIPGRRNTEPQRHKRERPQPPAWKAPVSGRHKKLERTEREAVVDRQKPGIKPRTIEEFPAPLFADGFDHPSFHAALDFQMRRHGDSCWHLHRAVVRDEESLDRSTIRHWLQGSKSPRSVASMEVLARIERRYRLPAGYFKAKLPVQTRSASGYILDDIGPAERRRLAWHLPDDFNTRRSEEQEEILEWVRRVIISGSTDYRKFQAAALKQRYAIRFPGITYGQSDAANDGYRVQREQQDDDGAQFTDCARSPLHC